MSKTKAITLVPIWMYLSSVWNYRPVPQSLLNSLSDKKLIGITICTRCQDTIDSL